MDYLIAIATLCQVTGTSPIGSIGTSYREAEAKQLMCQKYYINCSSKKNLKDCVLERTNEN